MGGGGLCGWGWTAWVGVDCVGGASATTYARICLIAFYFKLFLSHLFNLAIISRITHEKHTQSPFGG